MEVFISYSHVDSDFVDRLKADLEHYQIASWIDRYSLPPGTDFQKSIEQAILRCAKVLAIMSPESKESEWAQSEITYAKAKHKPIIPILLRPCDPPLALVEVNHIDFCKTGYDARKYYDATQKLMNNLSPDKTYYVGQRMQHDIFLNNVFSIPDENPLRDKRMEELLNEPSDNLRLLARTGASYLNLMGKNYRTNKGKVGIAALLKKGVPFRVLLDFPYKSQEELSLFRLDPPFAKVSASRICQLITENPNKICIHFTKHPVYCSLFFTANSVIYDPYHLGRRGEQSSPGNEFLVFEFQKQQEAPLDSPRNYYALLENHFENLWEGSISFKQLCIDYPNEDPDEPLSKFIPKLDAAGISC